MDHSSISYFIRGNTARGNIDYYASNFGKLSSVTSVEGLPRAKASSLLESLHAQALERGELVETVRHPLDTSLEGLIFPNRSCGIYCYDILRSIPEGRKSNTKYSLAKTAATISEKAAHGYKAALSRAGEHYTQALSIHDEWEQLYIRHLDFNKMNTLTSNLIEELLGPANLPKPGRIFDRFLGCATALGNKDYIEDLTSRISKRYFIKGRPGTGKSTLLKKLAQKAQDNGFDVEIYHCGFDPHSLDMVILRELSIALFDSTAPHEYFPSRTQDAVVDVYDIAKRKDVDALFATELAAISKRYKEQTCAAAGCLKEANAILLASEQELENTAGADEIDAILEAAQKDVLERLF